MKEEDANRINGAFTQFRTELEGVKKENLVLKNQVTQLTTQIQQLQAQLGPMLARFFNGGATA